MSEQNPHHQDDGLEAPKNLVEALNGLQNKRIFVPPAVDAAVLRKAGQVLRRRQPPASGWKSWLPWAATAACLALAVWLAERFNKSGAPFAAADINHDGRVDILDAFALARRIETGGTLDPRWDINGDGRVDRADVNAIATRAVSLGQVAAADIRRFRRQPAPDPSPEGNDARPEEIAFPSFGWAVGEFVEKLGRQKGLEAKRSEPPYAGARNQTSKPRSKEHRS